MSNQSVADEGDVYYRPQRLVHLADVLRNHFYDNVYLVVDIPDAKFRRLPVGDVGEIIEVDSDGIPHWVKWVEPDQE